MPVASVGGEGRAQPRQGLAAIPPRSHGKHPCAMLLDKNHGELSSEAGEAAVTGAERRLGLRGGGRRGGGGLTLLFLPRRLFAVTNRAGTEAAQRGCDRLAKTGKASAWPPAPPSSWAPAGDHPAGLRRGCLRQPTGRRALL